MKLSLLCKELRFSIPPKKIEYADFFAQFELLYRDAIMFEMKSEHRDGYLKSRHRQHSAYYRSHLIFRRG